MPKSSKASATLADDLPFEFSLISTEAVRVYTGGVRNMYNTAKLRHSMIEITNQYHLLTHK